MLGRFIFYENNLIFHNYNIFIFDEKKKKKFKYVLKSLKNNWNKSVLFH